MKLTPKRKDAVLSPNMPSASIITQMLRDGVVATAKIENLAVTTAKIDNLAVTNAKIALLAVEDANMNTVSITKLTAGNLTVTGTFTSQGKLVTGAASGARIELGYHATYGMALVGYNDATTEQFVIKSSDGKAYFGAGTCTLDATGLTIKEQLAKFVTGVTTAGLSGAVTDPAGKPAGYYMYHAAYNNMVLFTYGVSKTLYIDSFTSVLPVGTVAFGSASSRFTTGYFNTINVATSVVPDANNGADLGTGSLYFNNAYLTTLNVQDISASNNVDAGSFSVGADDGESSTGSIDVADIDGISVWSLTFTNGILTGLSISP